MIDEINASLRGLTQSAFFAFGRAVLYLLWFALFPRVARKKRKQMIVKEQSERRQNWATTRATA
jgi:hypothetical protein